VIVTPSLLIAAVGCAPVAAHDFADPITETCGLFLITTPGRLACFLAQTGHETQGFAKLSENLSYRRARLVEVAKASPAGSRWRSILPDAAKLAHSPMALAEAVYGGRMGNTLPGDGYKFRGRGMMHTTGRANYEALTEGLARKLGAVPDFTLHPDLLESPRWAALAAGLFWDDHDLNADADAGRFDRITQTINGGQNGRMDRRERWRRARDAVQAAQSVGAVAA
jgi:putative chitinase